MFPLPEWAPSVHPMLVHFPIALLFVAALFDVSSVVARKWKHGRSVGVALYVLGATAALAAFLSGRAAADSLLMSAAAEVTLTDHEDWASRTVWFFGVYALIRIALQWSESKRWIPFHRLTHALVSLIGIIGLVLVVQTGDRGARLVYKFGVGVQQTSYIGLVEHDHTTNHELGAQVDDDHREGTEPIAEMSSASKDNTTPAKRDVWSFRYLEGGPENLHFTDDGTTLELTVEEGTVLVVMAESHTNVLAEVDVNLSKFDGLFQLVHHVQGKDYFDFVSLTEDVIHMGRLEDGVVSLFDEESGIRASTWVRIRVVQDGRHYRAYVNDQMRVHGHAPAPRRGPVGLRIVGTGTVRVRDLSAETPR